MALFRGGWNYQPPLEMIFQGRLMAPAAPGNRIFRGAAPEDAFPGPGELLQYPAPVVGAGYICTRP